MMTPLWLVRKVAQLLAMSSLWLMMALGAHAHEIRPAVADVTLTPDTAVIEIDATLESLIAGLNLAGLADTNEAAGAAEYDRLRALDPQALLAELQAAWPQIATGFTLIAGETPVPLVLDGAQIAPVGDIELPRDSRLQLSAVLPADGSGVRFGWQAANGPLVVRQVGESGGYNDYLIDGDLTEPMDRAGGVAKSWLASFVDYIRIGFEHIVPKGLDHILFVLGLFFFAFRFRPLLMQVTAFTLAHTTTLALAILGYVQVPATVVEPLIAASIVFVAVENIVMTKMSPWRTAVVFGFGLLHGLGFASVLGDIGLDPARFATGLIGFNVGVELGQLSVIAAAALAVGWAARKPWYRVYISNPASAAIAVVGAYWFVQRTFF